jgi:hypothetical protein
MTHSSELCPGTSPYWVNSADIDLHFELVRHIFEWWVVHGIKPMTMSEYVLFLEGGNGVAL